MRKAAAEEEAAARIQEKGERACKQEFRLEHWIAEICKLLDEQRFMDEE